MLTASEFLQMSGRAGRRGMDEVGYVTIVGTPFQSPEEVAELVLSDANPLESRFSPSYSMVLNLLQRFSLDEAKELILKSFGYFSSGSRLQPILKQIELNNREIAERQFTCPHKYSDSELFEYDKIRHIYVQNRQTTKKFANKRKQKTDRFQQRQFSLAARQRQCLLKCMTFIAIPASFIKSIQKILKLSSG